MKTYQFNYEDFEVRCPICNELNFFAEDENDSGEITPCVHNLFVATDMGFEFISPLLLDQLSMSSDSSKDSFLEDYNTAFNEEYREDEAYMIDICDVVESLDIENYILLESEEPFFGGIYYGFQGLE